MDYEHVKKQLGYGIQTESKDNAIKALEQLTARVRELEADLAAARQIIDEENKDHIEQLATSQLSNQQLREALHYSLGAWHYDGVSDEHGSIFKEANDRCDTQPSTEALDAYVADKVKEYGDEARRQMQHATKAVWQRDLAVEWLERCAVHVRPTATIFYEEIMEALSAIKESEVKE